MASKHHLTVTWTGRAWTVDPATPDWPISPGTTFRLDVDGDVAPDEQESGRKPLFPKGTILYLALKPARNAAEVAVLWDAHKKACEPQVSKWEKKKEYVPIVLGQDLHLRDQGTTLASCSCHFDGKPGTFESVHAAASAALRRWTDVDKPAINVFDRVCFVHDRMLLALSHMRDHVLRGVPLPENSEAEDLTEDLFKRVKKA